MTGYVYGATRTATDLRKAGRLIHDLRRDLAQATTERDAAQAQLRRTAAQRDLLERLRSVDELKTVFLATASHELRTPLNAIIGYSEMLQEEFADAGGEEALAEDIRKIENNARHLLGLINEVLDMGCTLNTSL